MGTERSARIDLVGFACATQHAEFTPPRSPETSSSMKHERPIGLLTRMGPRCTYPSGSTASACPISILKFVVAGDLLPAAPKPAALHRLADPLLDCARDVVGPLALAGGEAARARSPLPHHEETGFAERLCLAMLGLGMARARRRRRPRSLPRTPARARSPLTAGGPSPRLPRQLAGDAMLRSSLRSGKLASRP